MKRIIIVSVAGALLYFKGYSTELTNKDGILKTSINQTNQYSLIPKEAQNYFEGFGGGDSITTISVEEQNMVENSTAQQGFVPQENGTGFYFVKNK